MREEGGRGEGMKGKKLDEKTCLQVGIFSFLILDQDGNCCAKKKKEEQREETSLHVVKHSVVTLVWTKRRQARWKKAPRKAPA